MDTKETQQLIDHLFAVGGHFGFQKSRRHPSVVPYLFGNKEGSDIIDLEKTAQSLEAAKEAITRVAGQGGDVFFVGSKDESRTLVHDLATEADAPYVSNRWVGGMLTNFSEIKKRLGRLKDFIAQGESGELDRKYTKKERLMINREMQKLTFNFGGMRTLAHLPKMLVVVDARHNHIAVEEAVKLGIPVVSISGTDNDISNITYPIIVNDSLVGSVRTVLMELTKAYKEARATYVPPAPIARAPRQGGERGGRPFRGRGDRRDGGPRRPFTGRKDGAHSRPSRAMGGRPQTHRATPDQA